MSESFFIKKLYPANLGKAGMHDKYITVPKKSDPSTFFGSPPKTISCIDKSSKKNYSFPFSHASNGEYRLTQFGNYFDDKNAEEGDEIIMKKVISQNSTEFIIDILKPNTPTNENKPSIIIEEKSLRQFALKVFIHTYQEFGEEFLLKELTDTDVGKIDIIDYKAIRFPKYFSNVNMLAVFNEKQDKKTLTTGKSQRYSDQNLNILKSAFIYFNYQWSHPKDSSSADFYEFKKFIEDWSDSKFQVQFIENQAKKIYQLISAISMKKLTSFDISSFKDACKSSGLIYKPELITRYIASLVTKPFVLLSGLSGSGKTKLAEAFAKWICESEEQYCIVPVGADWTNREPLLGYVNALENTEYILPENGALDLIIKANNKPKKPYFLILDEMNLSHVERYFADFLSVMESKETFKLHSSKTSLNSNNNEKYDKLIEVPSELGWPANLFVVGTVNIDETTYMFSPKVLDRANVIEFRVGKEDLENYFKPETNPLNMKKLWVEGTKTGLGAQYGKDFVKKSIEKTKKENVASINDELIEFFEKLQPISAEFGYRTASEIQTLFGMVDIINPKYDESEGFSKTYPKNHDFKIDIAIMQKLLPKIHGSRRKLSTPLKVLAELCLNEATNNIFKEDGDINITTDKIKYPLSFYKIARMYKSAIENGFASYAEA